MLTYETKWETRWGATEAKIFQIIHNRKNMTQDIIACFRPGVVRTWLKQKPETKLFHVPQWYVNNKFDFHG